MKVNEGTIDRALRVIAGLVLIGLAASGTIGVWGWIGVVPLLTGLFGFCPEHLPDEKNIIRLSPPRPAAGTVCRAFFRPFGLHWDSSEFPLQKLMRYITLAA
jgi:hypothetical protein